MVAVANSTLGSASSGSETQKGATRFPDRAHSRK